MPDEARQTEIDWEQMANIMQVEADLTPEQKPHVAGMIRQYLVLEAQNHDLTNIFSETNLPELKEKIYSLPSLTPEEIIHRVADLHLSNSDSEQEISHWALRHQTLRGELLALSGKLIGFRVTRFNAFTFLALAQSADEVPPRFFEIVFGKPADATSGTAFNIDSQIWSGWVWFMGKDPGEIKELVQPLELIWQSLQKKAKHEKNPGNR
jgi:hypothetical protein